ncbi:long-chain fatty acid--CoA ligase [Sorangium sp. So ce1099]|uniref:ANL family adenylate-forming protein n=1 Tax=Sorangium sp. So ce1099 TaxID=3133331 RepID=UPI003F605219
MRQDILSRLGEHGDRPAIIQDGRELTYAELVEAVRGLLAELPSRGVRPHDVVVLRGDFSFDAVALLLALHCNRNVIAPVVTLSELARAALDECCAPDHIIDCAGAVTYERPERPTHTTRGADGGRSPLLEKLRGEDAAGLVLLSSGSTGKPKAILHNLDRIVEAKLDKRGKGKLSIVLFLLFDHVGGINTLLNTLFVGSASVVLRERTPEEVCSLVERYRVRVLPTTPTFLNLILMGGFAARHDLSSLKLITYGTEPMPESLLARVRGAFPTAKLLQTFGTSETGISSTVSASSQSTYFKIEDAHFDHRIVDGELQLRSRTQFLGYLNQQANNLTDDGWFRTGDLVESGEGGFLRVKGRATEVINVGGEKVLPLEVESLLLTSALIEDCVVYGEPNAITGQHVCVDVKVRGAMSKADVRAHIQEFLGEKLDAFKIPSRIKLVDAVGRSERFKKKRLSL